MSVIGWVRLHDDVYGCADRDAADDSRTAPLRHAQVVPSQLGAWAITTNGRCAAFVLCEGETDGKHLVAKEDIQSASRRFVDDSKNVPANGWRFPRMSDAIPPDVWDRSFSVRLDAAYLLALQRALHDDRARSVGLELFIAGPQDPVIVQGANGFGLIMPMAEVRGDAAAEMRGSVDRFLNEYREADSPRRVVGEMIS